MFNSFVAFALAGCAMGQSAQNTNFMAATPTLKDASAQIATTSLAVQMSELINGNDSYTIFSSLVTADMAKDYSSTDTAVIQYVSYIPLVNTVESSTDAYWVQIYVAEIDEWSAKSQPIVYGQGYAAKIPTFGDTDLGEQVLASLTGGESGVNCNMEYDFITKETTVDQDMCLSPQQAFKPTQETMTPTSITWAVDVVNPFATEDAQSKFATGINTAMKTVSITAQFYDGTTYTTASSTVNFESGASTLALLGASLALVAATF